MAIEEWKPVINFEKLYEIEIFIEERLAIHWFFLQKLITVNY